MVQRWRWAGRHVGCGRVTRGRWAWHNGEGGSGDTWDVGGWHEVGGRGTMMKVGRATHGMWEGDTRKVGVVQWWRWAGRHVGCGRVTRVRWAWYNDEGGPGDTWDVGGWHEEGGRGTMLKVGRATRGMWEGDTRKVGVAQWWRWAWHNGEGGPGVTWDVGGWHEVGGRGTMVKVGRAIRGMWEGDKRKVGVAQWWRWAERHVGCGRVIRGRWAWHNDEGGRGDTWDVWGWHEEGGRGTITKMGRVTREIYEGDMRKVGVAQLLWCVYFSLPTASSVTPSDLSRLATSGRVKQAASSKFSIIHFYIWVLLVVRRLDIAHIFAGTPALLRICVREGRFRYANFTLTYIGIIHLRAVT